MVAKGSKRTGTEGQGLSHSEKQRLSASQIPRWIAKDSHCQDATTPPPLLLRSPLITVITHLEAFQRGFAGMCG